VRITESIGQCRKDDFGIRVYSAESLHSKGRNRRVRIRGAFYKLGSCLGNVSAKIKNVLSREPANDLFTVNRFRSGNCNDERRHRFFANGCEAIAGAMDVDLVGCRKQKSRKLGYCRRAQFTECPENRSRVTFRTGQHKRQDGAIPEQAGFTNELRELLTDRGRFVTKASQQERDGVRSNCSYRETRFFCLNLRCSIPSVHGTLIPGVPLGKGSSSVIRFVVVREDCPNNRKCNAKQNGYNQFAPLRPHADMMDDLPYCASSHPDTPTPSNKSVSIRVHPWLNLIET